MSLGLSQGCRLIMYNSKPALQTGCVQHLSGSEGQMWLVALCEM